uniref:PH domain-containing protein n=2 Tax=Rhodosorus marinus TaxID=101924 RepID=A0A7S2ZNL2_9RHOD|mmetsp:Transcript_25168/g.99258  ORF Transcript_25168/g.99258 Transcript_25168/m.99258 type:complete len:482 (+) Transcript_25168:203-1648(+)
MGRDSMSSERDLESCLLSEDVLERVIQPDACGYLMKRSGLGWYKYWFSLKGSKLYFFDKKSGYRGLMIGSISLFNAKVVVSDPVKRPLEFDVFEKIGKTHSLKAFTELEMQYWLTVFASARKKIPPPRPIATMEPPGVETGINNIRTKQVPNHVRVDRVMMVVHGIGTKGDNLEKNAGSLLKTCNEVKNKMFPDLDFNLEVLVVHWRDELLRLKIHEDMMKIIPNFQGGNALREFVMNRVLDMLYYTRDRTRNFLWKEVVTQLNGHYSEFKKRHPEFNGKLCLFGHSLGGIIVYEIASRQVTDDPRLLKSEGLLLDFEVESIYALGSPLGGFLTLEFKLGTLCLKPQDLPYRIYNIFHPNDPVALRLEPVVDDRYTPVPPVVIPHWRTMDKTQNAVKWLGGFWKPKSSNNLPRETFEAENQEEAPHTPNCSPELPTANSSKNLDQYRRYDYTLQVSKSSSIQTPRRNLLLGRGHYCTSRIS